MYIILVASTVFGQASLSAREGCSNEHDRMFFSALLLLFFIYSSIFGILAAGNLPANRYHFKMNCDRSKLNSVKLIFLSTICV